MKKRMSQNLERSSTWMRWPLIINLCYINWEKWLLTIAFSADCLFILLANMKVIKNSMKKKRKKHIGIHRSKNLCSKILRNGFGKMIVSMIVMNFTHLFSAKNLVLRNAIFAERRYRCNSEKTDGFMWMQQL